MSGHFSACPEGAAENSPGTLPSPAAVPAGRLTSWIQAGFSRPYRTATASILSPALKRRAIFKPSLPGRRKCPDIRSGGVFPLANNGQWRMVNGQFAVLFHLEIHPLLRPPDFLLRQTICDDKVQQVLARGKVVQPQPPDVIETFWICTRRQFQLACGQPM
jgi:hypothetical protein